MMYSIDWEAPDTRQRIQTTLDFLNKGCTCKTGCKTKRCSCVKKERKCGAGCECKGCVNVQFFHPSQKSLISVEDDSDNADSDNGSTEESEQSDEEELQTEIITDFFHEEEDERV